MRIVKPLLIAVAACLALVEPAFAQDGAVASVGMAQGFAAIGIGIAALGGAFGQSRTIAAALEAIGRNPGAAGQMFLPWVLGLVFIESLVIYALLVSMKAVGMI